MVAQWKIDSWQAVNRSACEALICPVGGILCSPYMGFGQPWGPLISLNCESGCHLAHVGSITAVVSLLQHTVRPPCVREWPNVRLHCCYSRAKNTTWPSAGEGGCVLRTLTKLPKQVPPTVNTVRCDATSSRPKQSLWCCCFHFKRDLPCT